MGYIGTKPSAVPLTSADITDNVITSAKIVDGTITNTDVASSIITGQTAETSIAGGDSILIYDDSATALRKMTRTNFVAGLGSGFDTQLLHVRDEKSAGTQGGGFTSGSFQTRTLNTELTNQISGASLSSNQITLPAGTYYVYAQAPAYYVEYNRLKLRNITDSSDTILGHMQYFDTTGNVSGFVNLMGRFTIGASKVFELQHRCSVTRATNGFGTTLSFSLTEVYADVQIWKVA